MRTSPGKQHCCQLLMLPVSKTLRLYLTGNSGLEEVLSAVTAVIDLLPGCSVSSSDPGECQGPACLRPDCRHVTSHNSARRTSRGAGQLAGCSWCR